MILPIFKYILIVNDSSNIKYKTYMGRSVNAFILLLVYYLERRI